MERQTFTREEYEVFLSLAPTSILEQVGNHLSKEIDRLPEDSPESALLAVMLLMLVTEYQARQVEPLWRKAQRFAIRNSNTLKQVGKVAACIGVGVFLGVSLDN